VRDGGLEDLHDVRVLEAARDARLLEEHLDGLRDVGEFPVRDLEHDELLETRGAAAQGEEDLARSATAERGDAGVAPEREGLDQRQRLVQDARPGRLALRGLLVVPMCAFSHPETLHQSGERGSITVAVRSRASSSSALALPAASPP